MPDIDIDFADRNDVLAELMHIPASIIKNGEIKRHNTGIYVQDIPVDPVSGLASIDYESADKLGYFKFDFLNINFYKDLRDNDHLDALLRIEPVWDMLEHQSIVDGLIHLNGNFDIVKQLKPRSIEDLAIVIAIKIPCKRYLIYRPRMEIDQEIWKPVKNEFVIKRAHGLAYSQLVIVQMNLLTEQI
jgi:hypothetical protein